MTACPCCEVRQADKVCTKCDRVVCSECVRPGGTESPVVCFCGDSCAEFEREWDSKRHRKVKA